MRMEVQEPNQFDRKRKTTVDTKIFNTDRVGLQYLRALGWKFF